MTLDKNRTKNRYGALYTVSTCTIECRVPEWSKLAETVSTGMSLQQPWHWHGFTTPKEC